MLQYVMWDWLQVLGWSDFGVVDDDLGSWHGDPRWVGADDLEFASPNETLAKCDLRAERAAVQRTLDHAQGRLSTSGKQPANAVFPHGRSRSRDRHGVHNPGLGQDTPARIRHR